MTFYPCGQFALSLCFTFWCIQNLIVRLPAPSHTVLWDTAETEEGRKKRQVSELRNSTLYCSSPGERGRAVQIFPFECLKDGGVFVALSSQVPQMAQCTSNGKPFIWPWDCTCCTSRWFMEETSSDSLSRRRRACGCKDIMEERHKRAGKWVRGWGRGEEGCYFCVIPQDPLLLGLAVRKKQFNLKVVQGKWTRELSCWNLIRDPPNYYYLPSRKVKWLH